MNVQKTRAQIRVVGPVHFENYEEEVNKALNEMTDVFIVQTQTIAVDENTAYCIITYKQTR